ncbi:MAG: hypothetical protein K0R02_1217 [Rickettsiaceae bacterium]|jgi:hypothetical protein|nr:hypothetical protein [Rickettsiaceae bacterium]
MHILIYNTLLQIIITFDYKICYKNALKIFFSLINKKLTNS